MSELNDVFINLGHRGGGVLEHIIFRGFFCLFIYLFIYLVPHLYTYFRGGDQQLETSLNVEQSVSTPP